jgi:hypothetical protein
MHHLLKSYVGTKISVLSSAKKVSGVLMYACDDYIVVETSPEVIDIVKSNHIVALEGLKYDTFLAAIGRKREAINNDMLVRAGQLSTQAS